MGDVAILLVLRSLGRESLLQLVHGHALRGVRCGDKQRAGDDENKAIHFRLVSPTGR